MNRAASLLRGRSTPLNAANAYDIAAPYYDDWKWQCFWQRSELPLILSEVTAFVKQRTDRITLLDIGCGTGKYLERLGRHVAHSIGVDVSARMLAVAAQRTRGQALVRAEATDLPLRSSSADLVLSTRMLSHLPNPDRAITEMARVLRRDGLLILSDVAAEHDYQHTRLPLSSGHIYVETYKHAFAQLAEMAEGLGLKLVRSTAITSDDHAQTRALRLRATGKLGWVAVWRQI